MDVCRNGLHQFIDAAATAQQLNLFLRHCGEEPDELDPAQLPDIIDHYVQGDPYRALATLEGVRTDREPGGLRRPLGDEERAARPPMAAFTPRYYWDVSSWDWVLLPSWLAPQQGW